MTSINTSQKTGHPKIVLVLMLAVLLGPLLFAMVLIEKGQAHHFRLNHHGSLISPAKSTVGFKSLDDLKLDGKWVLAYVDDDRCQATCDDVSYHFRQIKTALGKDGHRLTNLHIAHPSCKKSACRQLMQKQQPMVTSKQITPLELSLFFSDVGQSYYIIDPKGNIMMHYAQTTPPKDILTDLKRLLRISKQG